MNKFYIGSEVLFEGNRGVVRARDEYDGQFEYAVEFDDPSGMANLFGCTDYNSEEIIPKGHGAWIMEENLEPA